MKRMLSALLVLMMVLAFVPLSATEVQAAGVKIQSIIITDFKEPVAGQKPTDLPLPKDYYGNKYYTIDNVYWYKHDNTKMSDTETFQEDQYYYAVIDLGRTNGCWFDNPVSNITINGLKSKHYYANHFAYSAYNERYHLGLWEIKISKKIIDKIQLNGPGVPRAGQKVSDLKKTDGVSADTSSYNVTMIRWYDNETGYIITDDNAVFEKGKTYYANISVMAVNSTRFTDKVSSITIDYSSSRVDIAKSDNQPGYNNTQYNVYTKPYTCLDSIKEIGLYGFKTPNAGDKAGDYKNINPYKRATGTYSVALNAIRAAYTHYTVVTSETCWYAEDNSSGPMKDTDTFEAGKKYYALYVLRAKDGYQFLDNPTIKIDDDASLVSSGSINPAKSLDYGTYAAFSVRTVYVTIPGGSGSATEIDGIGITGYEQPEDGMSPAGSCAPYVKVDNTHAKIVTAYWFDDDEGEFMADDDNFVIGGNYSLRVVIKIDDGYTIADSAHYTVNYDEDNVDYTYTKYYKEAYGSYAANTLVLWVKSFTLGGGSTDTELEAIYIDDFELPKVGTTSGDYDFTALKCSPDQVTYLPEDSYWYDDTDHKIVHNDDQFVADHKYSMCIKFDIDSGYTYGDSTHITINGYESNVDYDTTYINDEGMLCVWSVPTTLEAAAAVTNLATINVDGYVEPKAGDALSDYDFDALKSTTEHFTVKAGSYWWVDEENRSLKAGESFEDGKKYSLCILGEFDENYYYDENTKFSVNDNETLADVAEIFFSAGQLHLWVVPITIGEKPVSPTVVTKHTITVTADGEGTAKAEPAEAAKDEKIKLTATPKTENDKFKEWQVVKGSIKPEDITATDADKGEYEFTMPDEDVEIKAVFESSNVSPTDVTKYKVTVTAEGNGTAKALSAEAAKGDTVNLSVTPNTSNDKFKEWQVVKGDIKADDIKATDAPNGLYAFTMPEGDVELKAVFESSDAPVVSDITVIRLAGATRTGTAAEIGKEAFGTTENVLLASGDNYADALAGVPLGYAKGAPILLVQRSNIDKDTSDALTAMGVKNITILGGTAAISYACEKDLQSKGFATERIAGATRFETSALIAAKLEEINGKPSEVFFACSNNYPDALAVGSAAALRNAPILYIAKDGKLNSAISEQLTKSGAKKATILGGTAAIAAAAEDSIKAVTGETPERIAGADRYETNLKINEKFASTLTGDSICIATGTNYPDALAGGVLAAKQKAPLLMINNKANALTSAQAAFVKAKAPSKLYVFGGTVAVPEKIVDSAKASAK